MLTELTIAIGLLVGLGICATTFLHRSGQLNGHLHGQMRCLAAAEAQLDSLATRREPLAVGVVERFWPGVAVTVDQEPGRGDWAGLTRLHVEATTTVNGRDVAVQLARYVPPTGGEVP